MGPGTIFFKSVHFVITLTFSLVLEFSLTKQLFPQWNVQFPQRFSQSVGAYTVLFSIYTIKTLMIIIKTVTPSLLVL